MNNENIKIENLRVAIVHEWLEKYAGSERVLERMISALPQADLYALVDFLPVSQRGFIRNKEVKTSFIQKLPFAKKWFRTYLPLMPLAIEQFDFSNYDLVVSSSHAVAKGVITGPDQTHICMCYSPMRYAWDLQQQYLENSKFSLLKKWIAKALMHYLRIWDIRTAHSVDSYIAISKFIAKRIKKTYGRNSTIIFPPVDVEKFQFSKDKKDYYLTVSRLVPYKKVDLIAQAFTEMPDKKLVIIGDGPARAKVQDSCGPNVQFLGERDDKEVVDYMRHAKAFIFAAKEDFGIAPLEAQACGTPVIAFAAGGALETVSGLDSLKPTGVFFENQTVMSLMNAVAEFENSEYKVDPASCRENAMRFSPDKFDMEFITFVANAVSDN